MSSDFPVNDGSRLREDILAAMDRITNDTSYPVHQHLISPEEDRAGEGYCIECGAHVITRITPACNGICLTGSDIGIPSDAIAAAHPDCPKHGHMATHNIDGTPRA